MKKIKEYILGTLGVAALIPIYIIFALSVPLSVLAIIHITGWGIWGALIAYAFWSFLPLANIIVMLIAPFFGAYYLIANDFSWSKAAYPEKHIAVLEFSEMSDEKYEKFKNDVIIPELIEHCKQSMVKQAGFEGKLLQSQIDFCVCFSTESANRVTKNDVEKGMQDKTYQALNEQTMEEIAIKCRQ